MSEKKETKRTYEDIKLDGPSEAEFTNAMHVLSEDDRTIFEDTGLIHIDRNMPAETQALHVVKLAKKHNRKRNRVYQFLQVMLVAGVLISAAGLLLNRMLKNRETGSLVRTEDIEGVPANAAPLEITDETFPDPLFRNYISGSADTDGDGYLSASERNSVLIIIVPEDDSITSLQGIEYFPMLQSLTFQNTGVSAVDLSSCASLQYIDCSGTPLSELSLADTPEVSIVDASDSGLVSLTFAEDSKVRDLNVSGTALSCEKDEEGFYTTCN